MTQPTAADPPDAPLRGVQVLDPGAAHEPFVLFAPRPAPGGGTVEIDVDGHGVRVLFADLVDAVAACGADLAVEVRV